MSVFQYDDSVTVHHDDCLNVLRGMADASVDAVVTDPPYGLADHQPQVIAAALAAWLSGDREHVPDGKGFMGRDWDRFVPPPAVWDECLRVLKPGGWLLAFAGSRTADLMGMSVRLAGFEIRDGIDWLYGSGFPKSLDVSKAIDKAAGERTLDPAAARWSGWGTALKPAREPIVVARKPLAGTVAATVLAHGTGALNIDGCRVAVSDAAYAANCSGDRGHAGNRKRDMDFSMTAGSANDLGRWPSNVVLSHSEWCEVCECGARGPHEASDYCYDVQLDCPPGCPVAELDRQSGMLTSGKMRPTHTNASRSVYGQNTAGGYTTMETYGDSGGASRFFPVFRYQAKAASSERPRTADGSAHATVKPLELMRWLVRLVTPAGGTVLEPFAGSGTTAEACVLEGFRCVAVEREPAYLPLIVSRLSKPLQPSLDIFGEAVA